MTFQRQDQRQAVIEDLQALVTFLAEHPELPVDADSISHSVRGEDDERGIAQVAAIARALGVEMTTNADRQPDSVPTHFYARRKFGKWTYQAAHVTRDYMANWRALMSYDNAVRPEDGAQ